MPIGLELISGTVEKLSGVAEKSSAVRVPFVMRVLLPGLLGAVLLFPLVIDPAPMLNDAEKHWIALLIALALVLLLGVIISAVSGSFYVVFEGRSLWPDRLLNRGIARQQRRVKKLMAAQQAIKDKNKTKYDEIWNDLRAYPTDDIKEDPYAARPTRLGNILFAYEEYPRKRYGMDAVFYWTRIWMDMDVEKKQQIDNAWSLADGFVSLAAVSFIGGVLWIALGLLNVFGLSPARMPVGGWTFLSGLGFVVLGYIFYRSSLPFNRANGELFKSIFDLYRGKAKTMMKLKPNEKAIWDAAWAYLQYGMIRCTNCGEYNVTAATTCASCHTLIENAAHDFSASGKFPQGPRP